MARAVVVDHHHKHNRMPQVNSLVKLLMYGPAAWLSCSMLSRWRGIAVTGQPTEHPRPSQTRREDLRTQDGDEYGLEQVGAAIIALAEFVREIITRPAIPDSKGSEYTSCSGADEDPVRRNAPQQGLCQQGQLQTEPGGDSTSLTRHASTRKMIKAPERLPVCRCR